MTTHIAHLLGLMLPSTASNTDLLLVLALAAITGLAIFLYLPRRFSGPLTDHERRMAHRGRIRRSFALVLVAPLATIAGLWLLTPPFVALDVRSRGATVSALSGERPLLARFFGRVSIEDWTSAVLCKMDPLAVRDGAALKEAIVAAAGERFRIGCAASDLSQRFNTNDFRSVELTLVELAVRAYALTDVEIHAGPRLQDPDPWDVMAALLRARGLEPRGLEPRVTSNRGDPATSRILRLSRARLHDASRGLEVLALVRGDSCEAFDGKLSDPAGTIVKRCSLRDPRCPRNSDSKQRVVAMGVHCDEVDLERLDGHTLSAGDGWTTVNAGSLALNVPPEMQDALAAAEKVGFSEEMRRHGLRPLVHADKTPMAVAFADDAIVVAHEISTLRVENCQPSLDRGPFSWSGLNGPPQFHHEEGKMTIPRAAPHVSLDSPEYDPSALLATLYTITWAANVLHTGRCLELALPLDRDTDIPAHPVLSAAQMDEAVASLRRERESLGLVAIALAILALALGLRRSVL